MAREAGAGVLAQGTPAARNEARRVGVNAPTEPAGISGRQAVTDAAHRRGCVAGDAIALHVAAHASVEVALGFPGVVTRATWRFGPDRRWRMEATSLSDVADRTRHRDARALMAAETERLLLVAARAGGVVLARRDGVHAQE